MENFILKLTKTKFLLFTIVFALSFLIVFFALAYSPYYTHPDLTEEIAKLWNLKNGNQKLEISQNEIEWMRQGAIDEDKPARWINHFYDPINNVGWQGKHFGNLSQAKALYEGESMAPKPAISSIDWATNQEYQSAYGRQFGNQTWQKAIKAYIDGDKKSAFIALGHVLHLIEDASVPDHTRNDTHADLHGDTASPYEEYAKSYTNFNKLTIAESLKNQSFYNFTAIQDAFNYLANYSNNNFFSKDTISNEEFNYPDLKSLLEKGDYLYDEKNDSYLAQYQYDGNKIFYTLNDSSIVLPSYFTHLAPQAVLTGASVLNLFFQEVEKYKNNPELLPEIIPDSNEAILSYLQKSPRLALVNLDDARDKATTNTQIYLAQIGSAYNNGISTTYNAISNLIGNIFSFGNNNNNANNTQNTQANIINQINNVNQSSSAANQQTQVQSRQNQSSSQNQLTIQNNSNQQINNQLLAQILNNAQQTNQSNNQLSISQIQSQLLNIQAQANSLLQQLNNIKSQNQNNALNNQNQSIGQTIFYGGVSATTQAVNQNSQSTNQVQNHQETGNQEITSDLSGATSTIISASTSTSTQNQAIQSQSASSSSSAAQNANHIVISEIQAGTDNNPDDEFIELYNPTSNDISLGGFSLKRRVSKNATSTKNLALNFSATSTISAKSFFLISHKDYSGSIAPDIIYSNNSNPLAYKDDIVFLEDNNGAVIDEVYYAEIPKGKSLERKANAISTADSMAIGGDRFSGNGYDTDGVDDFILRDNPSPQNSNNFPEPRNAPTVPSNFNIQYNATTTELIFNWQASQDYSGATSTLAYNIFDVDNPTSTYRIGRISSASAYMTTSTIQISASTTLNIYIDEIGRSYNFSIQATNKEGLSSASSSAAISIPSFLPNIYFYKDPRASSTDYLIEAFYDQYPFVPDLYQDNANASWKILVFYLDSEPTKEPMIDSFSSYPFNKPYNNLLVVKYPRCSGDNYYSVGAPSEFLILPDISARCGIWGGTMNLAMNYPFEDNHFIIRAASSSLDAIFTPNDYITAAYYSFHHSSWWAGAGEYFQLEAIDKKKHYFGNAPSHQPPTEPQNLTAAPNENYLGLIIDWENSTDSDSTDSLIKYELNYSLSDEQLNENNWQEVGKSFAQTSDENGNYILVQTGPIIPIDIDYINSSDSYYNIYLRAKDEFGNTAVSSTTWPLQVHLQ